MPTTESRAAARSLPFEIRRSSIQGRGAFATRRIRAGQRIVEYTGERVSPDVADARYDEDGMGRHHTFLFTLDDDTVVDGARGGNESRFINHSCAPNCEAVIEKGRIWVYAKKPIAPGEELTYDYQYERFDWHTKKDEEFYACRCGAARCRGSILKPRRGARKAAAKGAGKSAAKGARKPAAKDAKAASKRQGTAKRTSKGSSTRALGTGGAKRAEEPHHLATRHARRKRAESATKRASTTKRASATKRASGTRAPAPRSRRAAAR